MRDADALVDARRAELIALIADLVAAPSINPPGDVRAPARVIADYFTRHGITPEVIGPAPEKPNVVARVDGAGAGPHLVLNGHLDTIPPGDETLWSVPLFDVTRTDGRMSGLGIGNMKAGTAALALATVILAEQRSQWRGTLTFTAVGDEITFGPDGAAWLLDARPDLIGDALLCAEGPGFMNLAVAEKGLLWLEAAARVPPAQGMTATARSTATAQLSAFLADLDLWNDRMVTAPTELAAIEAHAGAHGLRLSVNCGLIDAPGLASQVAPNARAHVDFRVPPGLTIDAVEREARALAARYPAVTIRRLKGWDPSWTSPAAPLPRAVADAFRQVRGAPVAPVVRLPASDAARWRRRGVPAICFGPQPTLAAGIDDYALEADIIDCAKIYARAALSLLARDQTAE